MSKPYYLRSQGKEGGAYVRLGRHTVRANGETLKELQWQSRGIDFERLPVLQASVEDLNEDAIKKFIEERKNHGEQTINEALLRSYNVISFDQSKKYPSVLGMLLFGRFPQKYYSEAMIICTHFTGVEGREAIAAVDCEGSLFEQFHQAFTFLKQRLYQSFKIKGLKREVQSEVPEVAIREALLNMIVHRN